MQIWRGSTAEPQNFHGCTVTIGKFDGLHLGHQKLLEAVRKGPKPWVVMTFDPLPLQFLQPFKGYRRLMPKDDLETQLPGYDIDVLRILTFDQRLAEKSPEQFAGDHLLRELKPARIVVGFNFAMGKNRVGGVTWLREWAQAHAMIVDVVAPVERHGLPVSSGRLRELVQKGDMGEAAALLGRRLYLRGEVIKGAGRGRTIGVPTLNQRVVNETLPLRGVYASRTHWRGQVYASVTNVGSRPTFGHEDEIQIETHVLGVDMDAYGESVDVELIQRLRPEKKFGSVEDLKKQIQQDILEAKGILGEKMDLR